jgi:hypothetical protein
MIVRGVVRPLCVILAIVIGIPLGAAQAPQQPAATAGSQTVPAVLKIIVLEGNNGTNSISLGRSVTPIIEVRDQNEFPLEGATVVFTLPAAGPGGTFPGNKTSFTTRTDPQGQASAPFLVNGLPGRVRIGVIATAGNRKGEIQIDQTNSAGGYIGPALARRPWYKKWYIWAIVGGAAGAGAAVALTRGGGSSSSSTITIIPGGPVFGGPR